jgi:hypothetical protein
MPKTKTKTVPASHEVSPAMYGCILFYSASIYLLLETLGEDQQRAAADVCTQASMREPLWTRRSDTGEFPQIEVPGFGRRSGPWCMAYMSAYLIWTQRKPDGSVDRKRLPVSPLLSAAADGYAIYRPPVRK